MSNRPSNDLAAFGHVSLLFPSKYLCAADLRGKDATVTIERIAPRDELMRQGGQKEYKPVVYFKGKEKSLVLNKTNAKTIAKLYGNEVTAWIGQAIVIYPTRAQFGKEDVDAIRVRPYPPKAQNAAEPGPARVSDRVADTLARSQKIAEAFGATPSRHCVKCGLVLANAAESEAHACGDEAGS
jgi:hypothetical protein